MIEEPPSSGRWIRRGGAELAYLPAPPGGRRVLTVREALTSCAVNVAVASVLVLVLVLVPWPFEPRVEHGMLLAAWTHGLPSGSRHHRNRRTAMAVFLVVATTVAVGAVVVLDGLPLAPVAGFLAMAVAMAAGSTSYAWVTGVGADRADRRG